MSGLLYQATLSDKTMYGQSSPGSKELKLFKEKVKFKNNYDLKADNSVDKRGLRKFTITKMSKCWLLVERYNVNQRKEHVS